MPPARPLHHAEYDELTVALRQPAGEARHGEERETADEHPLVTEPVPEAAGRDEGDTEGERVAGNDPRQHVLAGRLAVRVDVLANGLQGRR